MKLTRQIQFAIVSLTLLVSASAAWAAQPGCDLAEELSSALLCKQNNCPELNQVNAQGHTPEEIYFVYCSDYGREIQNRIANATVDIVIFELERTRYPKPPTFTPPCECLAMFKGGFGACEVEQCAPPEEQPKSPGSDPAPAPNSSTVDTGKDAGIPPASLFQGSGCSVIGAASDPTVDAAMLLGLFSFTGYALRRRSY